VWGSSLAEAETAASPSTSIPLHALRPSLRLPQHGVGRQATSPQMEGGAHKESGVAPRGPSPLPMGWGAPHRTQAIVLQAIVSPPVGERKRPIEHC